MADESRDQWLKNTKEYFREVRSFNTTVITVGYATFFGLLFFFRDAVKSPLLFWAALLVVLSAAIFVAFELINNIKLAWGTRQAGIVGKRFFRYWACFFIPSVLLAAAGTILLVIAFLQVLCNFG